MKVGEVGEVVFNQPGSRPIMGRYQTTQQPTTTVKVRMITDGVAGGRQAGTVRICRIDGDTMTPYQPGDRVNLTQMARIM